MEDFIIVAVLILLLCLLPHKIVLALLFAIIAFTIFITIVFWLIFLIWIIVGFIRHGRL